MDNYQKNIRLAKGGRPDPSPFRCDRCEGTGEIPATEARFWLYMKELNALIPAGGHKVCDMFKVYHYWRRTGLIKCPMCSE